MMGQLSEILPGLQLTRSIVMLDLETTGLDVETDRILEIAMVRIYPKLQQLERMNLHTYLNPEIPIDPEATAVHGISIDDVRDKPTFRAIAPQVVRMLIDADVMGYNARAFDVPILQRQLKECGHTWDLEGVRIVDPMRIMKAQEQPYTLAAALHRYTGREPVDAHSAYADVMTTAEVLRAQIRRYGACTVDALVLAARKPNWLDDDGKILDDCGTAVFGFGGHQGEPLCDHLDYCHWMLGKDFPDDTKRVIREVLGDSP